jgi:hypothetical protein
MFSCDIKINKNDKGYFKNLKTAIKELYPNVLSRNINDLSRITFYYYVYHYPSDIYKSLENACNTFNIEREYLFDFQINLDDDALPISTNIQNVYLKKYTVKKKTDVKGGGVGVKERAASTRNGFVHTFSKEHSPSVLSRDVLDRDSLLNIDHKYCFWCKVNYRECSDHAHPCCNTKLSEYSYTNALNIVPSCNKCNSKKGGRKLQEWVDSLNSWSEHEKTIYKYWLGKNESKLLMDAGMSEYVNKQFITINKIHEILQYCSINYKNVDEYIKIL